MSIERPGDERPPISWDAVAAELAATREEAERSGIADPAAWDAVAAELATRVVDRPAERSDVPAVPAEDDDAVPPAAGRVEAGIPPAPEPVELLDAGALRGGLEAVLFVAEDPLDEETLAAALRCPAEQVRKGLADLVADLDGRTAGTTLRRVGEGWRLYTRDEYAAVVERYLGEGHRNRLSQAALETLAVIAYRQPVTRARISGIRGVGVDAVMRTLLARGLVRETGTDPDTGGGLYVTTPLFLERLGLTGLEDLPELAPLLPEASSVLDEHPDA